MIRGFRFLHCPADDAAIFGRTQMAKK